MINEKAVLLLEQIIKEKYKSVLLDNKAFNEEEFFYEFKIDEKISENDFKSLEPTEFIMEVINICSLTVFSSISSSLLILEERMAPKTLVVSD